MKGKKIKILAVIVIIAVAGGAYAYLNTDLDDIINPPPASPYEDLTTYIHDGEPIGSPPYMALLSNHTIQISNMPRIAECYFQKAMPIGSDDFTLEFYINATELEKNPTLTGVGGTLTMLFTNDSGTTNSQISQLNDDGIQFTFREYTNETDYTYYLIQIRSRMGTTTDYWQEMWGQLNTIYKIQISRTAGVERNVAMKVFDIGNNLLGTRTIKDDTVINYFLPMCGRGGGGADNLQSSGFAYNFLFS